MEGTISLEKSEIPWIVFTCNFNLDSGYELVEYKPSSSGNPIKSTLNYYILISRNLSS